MLLGTSNLLIMVPNPDPMKPTQRKLLTADIKESVGDYFDENWKSALKYQPAPEKQRPGQKTPVRQQPVQRFIAPSGQKKLTVNTSALTPAQKTFIDEFIEVVSSR